MGSGIDQPVTLDNCDIEPIHIPGAIQPHGALLALSLTGIVLAQSENFSALTQVNVEAGMPLSLIHI